MFHVGDIFTTDIPLISPGNARAPYRQQKNPSAFLCYIFVDPILLVDIHQARRRSCLFTHSSVPSETGVLCVWLCTTGWPFPSYVVALSLVHFLPF